MPRIHALRATVYSALFVIAATQVPTASDSQPKAPRGQPVGTLAQLMRAVYFTNANLIFDVQSRDPSAPSDRKNEASGGASATFANVYSGWPVVENAAVALAESTDLIMLPGRLCQNGKRVPVQQATYAKFAQAMRDAGIAALKVARSKNREQMIEVTNQVADACSNCHERYRDAGDADSPARCTP